MAPPLKVCAAREIIPDLWGMSQTPGIISLGPHNSGKSQGSLETSFSTKKKLEGFDRSSKKRCEDLAT